MNKKNELVIVLDFGGQYNQLIARRVRECNVYCEIKPYTVPLEELKKLNPKGIIFTGGPNSVYKEDSATYTKEIFEMDIPILGICYGSQLMAYKLDGKVDTAPVSVYGHTEVDIDTSSLLFKDIEEKNTQAEINTEEEIQESVIEIKEAAAVDLEITPTKEDRISVANNTTGQMDFAMIEKDALIKEISAIEIMTMTPLDAMNKLFEIVQKSKNM